VKNGVGIFVAVMIMLAWTGVAFSRWGDALCISGTVGTNEVNAVFYFASSNDPLGQIDPGYDRDVACTVVEGIGTKALLVTITNAYPCYSSRVDYSIKNIGIVPIIIQGIDLDENLEAPGSQDILEIDVIITDIQVGEQIDPGQEENGGLEIHINQYAIESSTYEFTATILLSTPPPPNKPPMVKCKWEQDLTGVLEDGDPTHLTLGSQFLPPCEFEGKKTVQYWAVITDEEDRGNVKVVSADVWEPDNTFKYQVPMTKVDKPGIIDNFKAAAGAGLVRYGLGHAYDSVLEQLNENLAEVWMGEADLDYHQMAGDYEVRVTAIDQADNLSSPLSNTFLYMPVAACEFDFTKVNYGNVSICTEKWIGGDNIFSMGDNKPTVRNIGNVPCQIVIQQDDMGFGRDVNGPNVSFDARLGATGTSMYYNPSVEVTLPDVLDRCNTEKLDFSIHFKKGIVGQLYSGIMHIWCELESPGQR